MEQPSPASRDRQCRCTSTAHPLQGCGQYPILMADISVCIGKASDIKQATTLRQSVSRSFKAVSKSSIAPFLTMCKSERGLRSHIRSPRLTSTNSTPSLPCSSSCFSSAMMISRPVRPVGCGISDSLICVMNTRRPANGVRLALLACSTGNNQAETSQCHRTYPFVGFTIFASVLSS